MKQELETSIGTAVQQFFNVEVAIELTRPEEQFGDYATNVALQLSKQVGKNPREIGESLAEKLRADLKEQVSEISVAGPGFLNLKLTDTELLKAVHATSAEPLKGQTVVAEYSDPNPFKVLHAGHVYTTVVGDAIANLLENAGAQVHRVNYGGDVGLHVAKTMWAILHKLEGEYPDKLQSIPKNERASWLSKAYVEGTAAYEEDESAKAKITHLNKLVYALHAQQEKESPLAQIYWTCRQWSYEAFDAFYERLGTHMERYYPESEVADIGLQLVKDHLGKVFQESEGAVIFDGEKHGLHTRVFINSEGLPTYEAKELGLIVKKKKDYNFDRSVVITGNEQQQYMAVMLKAIEQFMPELAAATQYIPHGMVRLAGNVKMSSRLGNIIPAPEVLRVTSDAIVASGRKADDSVVLGAIKYAFLKNRIGGDLVYDPNESVSLEGNSGPYLQYAHARAQSILRKSQNAVNSQQSTVNSQQLQAGERSLVRKLSEYAEIVDKATAELMPHHIATYLYELAQTFNRFYEGNRVIGDERESLRLALVKQYAETLKAGLNLLGITAPDTM